MANRKIKKEEVDQVLDEIINENVSIDNFQEITEKSLETSEYEKVNALLLDYYNKKNNTDFQEVLKQELKLMVNEKVLSKLQNSGDLEKAKEEKIDDEAKDIINEEGVDKKTLDEAKEKVKDEQNKEQNKEYDLRAELMKHVYVEEFKKYSATLYKLKETQAYNRELTVGQKQGTELVMYEKYLASLETKYKAYASTKGLSVKEINQDNEIKDLKDKLKYQVGKKEEYIDDKVGKRMNNFRELFDKRENISSKMLELVNSNMAKENPEEFKKQMDNYQDEYRKITYEIRVQDPSLEEYQNQILIEKENKEFANKEIRSQIGFASGYSDEQRIIDESELKQSNESRAVMEEQDIDMSMKENLDDLIRKTQDLIYLGKFDEAEECLQSAEDMVALKENGRAQANDEIEETSNEDLDYYMDKRVNKKSDDEIIDENKNIDGKEILDPGDYEDPFTINKECANTKLEESDVSKKDKLNTRLRTLNEKYNQLYGKIEKEAKEKDDFVRTRLI